MNLYDINIDNGLKPAFEIHDNDCDFRNQYLLGDCEKVLEKISEDTFHLIVTSPPYADNRKKTYGGIKPDKYVEWPCCLDKLTRFCLDKLIQ
jgi:DNA modification methylase